MSKPFYITTAIDYVNGEPHLGHAYEKVITDVIARAHRSLGNEVFFLTGLDEHGQKVQQAAEAEGKSPQEYCDRLAVIWKHFASTLGLSNDEFVRTTEPRHIAFIQAALSKFNADGRLYKAEYHGFYSAKEETFLTDRDRREDGTFDPIWGPVIELSEENYYFRTTQEQSWLIEYIESHPSFVAPIYRRNEVLGFLKNNTLEDLCITRPAERLTWGIPLPFDKNYVTYVWFDALLNYASIPAALGDPGVVAALSPYLRATAQQPGAASRRPLWPADLQVIGKDILKFHAIYWPIFLKALGLPLPKQILAHGFWQKDGQKISKSLGNIIDPVRVINEWGVDAFRFYVTRELDIGADGNWTDAGFQARYQAELANGLGNLVNRSLSMLKRYRNGVVPAAAADLASETADALKSTTEHLRAHELQAGLQAIWVLINRANQYVDQTAPFRLAKDPNQQKRLDEVLYTLAETCRVLAVLLWPFLPTTAGRIHSQLGLSSPPNLLSEAQWGLLKPGHQIGEPAPLFPRKDLPQGQTK
jgi:methionyl-tRNA synthetase